MGNSAPKYNKITLPFTTSIHTVTSADVSLARNSWHSIICNETTVYIEMMHHKDFHTSSCLAWFYDKYDFVLSMFPDLI